MFENLFIKIKLNSEGIDKWYSQTKKLNNSLSNISKDANRTANGIGKFTASMKGLNQVIGVGKLVLLGNQFATSINSALDMIETTNLFNVALGDMAEETNNTVTEMHNLFGLDPTNLQNSIGTFGLLSRSMSMSTDQSQTLSTNMAKLATDLSSLTNVPIAQVMGDLKSGLVGQSETVYKYGIDVTEAGIKTEAFAQGIDKSVRNMSQGEKMALRYSAMLRQTTLAQGDFAKTINSPANQLKILYDRFTTLSRAIGSIFIPILSATLPYLNAFVMILTDVANAIASFLGFVAPKVESKNNVLGVAEDDANNVSKAIGGATAKVKAFKSVLLGIDEINTLQQPTDTADSGGGGGVGVGGESILPTFELPSYDNLMSGVKVMADDIKKSLVDGWNSINFLPLTNSFNWLVDAIEPVIDIIGSNLKFVFDNVLVPLAKWTITKALPSFLDTLTSAFQVLEPIMTAMKEVGEELFFSVFKPMGEFVGDLFLSLIHI